MSTEQAFRPDVATFTTTPGDVTARVWCRGWKAALPDHEPTAFHDCHREHGHRGYHRCHCGHRWGTTEQAFRPDEYYGNWEPDPPPSEQAESFRDEHEHGVTDPRPCHYGANDGIASPTCHLLAGHDGPHRTIDGWPFS